MQLAKKYLAAISEAIVPAPFRKESLYPGITLVQENKRLRAVEEFSKLQFGVTFVHSFQSSVVMIENYQGEGSLHASVKEYIVYECPDHEKRKFDGNVPLEAEAIGYSRMPKYPVG